MGAGAQDGPRAMAVTRILFVDAGPVFGGAQRSLLELINALEPDRWQPHLLVAESAEIAARAAAAAVPVRPLQTSLWQRSWRGMVAAAADCLRARPAIRAALDAARPHLVHANGLQAALLWRAAGDRTPWLFHHRDSRCPPPLLRAVVAAAERTVTVSDFVRDRVLRAVPDAADRVVRIHNGVAPPPLEADHAAALRQRLRLPEEAAVVALIADPIPWKNHRLAIEATAFARLRSPQIRLVIAGAPRDAAGERYLAELHQCTIDLGLTEHVRFAGRLPGPGPLLAIASALVSATAEEPFGRTVVEALASGLPVVAVDGGGPAEILAGSPAGLRVPIPADAESLGTAMAEAVAIPAAERAAVAEAARTCARRFTPDAHRDALAAVWREILSQ